MGEPAPEMALRLGREALDQPFRDQQAEHAVADEFQPFVRGPARLPAPSGSGGAVRHRLAQQVGPGELVAENLLDRHPLAPGVRE